MVIQTARFGQIEVNTDDIITIPGGVLGFPESQRYCLVDPGDETLILWLQSLDSAQLCFPVLEPKIFKPDYIVRLSGAELRELRMDSLKSASVMTILTIPSNLTEMTANLKAPLVVNVQEKIGKQVVLQENDQPIKFPMFKELRSKLLALQGQMLSRASSKSTLKVDELPLATFVQMI